MAVPPWSSTPVFHAASSIQGDEDREIGHVVCWHAAIYAHIRRNGHDGYYRIRGDCLPESPPVLSAPYFYYRSWQVYCKLL